MGWYEIDHNDLAQWREIVVVIVEFYRLEQRQWANQTQLKEYITRYCSKYYFWGEDIDRPKEFFSVIIRPVDDRLEGIGVGICSLGIGLQPVIYLQEESNKLIIGYNSNVCGLNLNNGAMTFCYKLNSPFYDIVVLPIQYRILIQHEVGVVMLTEEGEILWKFDGDIITGLQHSENALELQFMDMPTVSLALDSGKPIR